MITRTLRASAAFVATTVALVGCTHKSIFSEASSASVVDAKVTLRQIRNATIKVEYAGTTFLIDPMLAPKGAYAAFPGTVNAHLRNPLVDLPLPAEEVAKADAVIVTHTHLDHWDEAAKRSLPKDLPVFVQDSDDADIVQKAGFVHVQVLGEGIDFKGTILSRTGGQHGTDAMVQGRGKALGKSSGVVFQRNGFKTVYVAGDTLWNEHVETALARYKPDVIVLNTCYGRLVAYDGGFIMGKEDLYRAYQSAPQASIIASHMETIAHCTHTRKSLTDFINQKQMSAERVLVPADGQAYSF
ncbi:MAG: MBL fold metallo-hydrolase [Telluria sp.]